MAQLEPTATLGKKKIIIVATNKNEAYYNCYLPIDSWRSSSIDGLVSLRVEYGGGLSLPTFVGTFHIK